MFQRLLPAIVVLFLVISYANILHCRGEDDIDFDPDEFAAPSVRQHQPLPTESSTESLDNSDDNEEEEEEIDSSEFRLVTPVNNQNQKAPSVGSFGEDIDFDDEEFENVIVVSEDVSSPENRDRQGKALPEDGPLTPEKDKSIELDLSVEARAAARLAARPWDASEYVFELVGLILLVVYLVVYMRGVASNRRIMNSIAKKVIPLLRQRFAHVGDPSNNEIIEEAGNEFALFGTGNRRCMSFKVDFILRRRHDVLGLIIDTIFSQPDIVVIAAELDERFMPPLVFCVCKDQVLPEIRSENEDIEFLGKGNDRCSTTLRVLTDSQDVQSILLSGAHLNAIKDLEAHLQHFKITDQYRSQKIRRSNDWSKKDLKLEPGLHAFTMQLSLDLSQDKHHDAVAHSIRFALDFIESVAALKLSAQARARAKKLRDEFFAPIQKEISNQQAKAVQERAEQRKQQEREELKSNPQKLAKWEEKQKEKQERKQLKQGRVILK